MLEVEYDNRAPWPVAAFDTGHSLVLSHLGYGENNPRAWSASDPLIGTGGYLVFTNGIEDATQRFYRVRIEP